MTMKIFPSHLLLLLWMPFCHAQFPMEPNVAAVPGWPGLHWGMNPTEVLEAFRGKAKMIPKRQILYPVDGSPDLVRINKLVLDGVSYRVQFAFDTNYAAYFNRVTTPNGL